MKSTPLTTTTLVQLMTAAQMAAPKREQARELHQDDEAVTLTRQPDYTYRLAFESGETMHLSYQEGSALDALLRG